MNRATPLLDWAFSQADKAAIVTDDASYSFGQLRDAILSAAATLVDRVAPGGRVGLFIDSTPNFVIYQYAVFYLGGVVVPINRAQREAEVLDVVEHLGIDLVVADTELDFSGSRAGLYVVDGEFHTLGAQADAPPMVQRDIDDAALVLQTSGSTGRPKGVQLSIRNLAANYDSSHRWIGVGKEDVILLTLPIFNTYALNQGINMMAMTGATMRLLRRFSPESMQRAFDDSKPTFLPMVPTMLTRLYQAGIVYDHPVLVGIGAAASPSQIAQDAWNVFPQGFLYFGYGLTEGTAIESLNRVGTKESNNGDFVSSGPVVPGVQLRLAPSDEPDGRGEILIRGECVFSAYVGTDEPRPVDDEGWISTGDIGVFDGDSLRIVDRKRELIIRGGQNIYPGEVERVLSGHEAVLEASVVGAADDDFGEVPVAFAVLRNGRAETGEEILEWMRPQLAAFKVPAVVHVIENMPKTPTGKIRKLDLREWAASGGRPGAGA